MSSTPLRSRSRRCLFCHMPDPHRFLGLSVCAICRDQMYDFLWASAVQGLLVLTGVLGGLTFVLEEVLLFTVLVVAKHRLPPRWQRAPGG